MPQSPSAWRLPTCAADSEAWMSCEPAYAASLTALGEVDRGLAMSAETVADLRSLSTLPPGLVLVIDELEPRFNVVVRLERAWIVLPPHHTVVRPA